MAPDEHVDKQWAHDYILDPLTAPEPSQETGPGSSHLSELYRSPSQTSSHSHRRPQPHYHSRTGSIRSKENVSDRQSLGTPEQRHYPTPPSSASPTQSSFHPSNPFFSLDTYQEEDAFDNHSSRRPSSGFLPSTPSRSINRSSSVRTPNPSSQFGSPPHRSASTRTHGHSRSLSGRFPGDMSHRPLDTLKRDARAADRGHARPRAALPDTIDALDTIGGGYHHGGPYDATLASRNTNKNYSPIAAVQVGNMKALRATPREFVDDSLKRHMPLQGTSSVPVGGSDLRGNIMRYEEGADLMREPDAPGGAYKRWQGELYHPDDLKGKGEPSYTIERDIGKNGKRPEREYEMESGVNSRLLRPHASRQRSVSNADAEGSSSGRALGQQDNDLRRSNTTGKKISEGLKRRFGSIRRKKADEE